MGASTSETLVKSGFLPSLRGAACDVGFLPTYLIKSLAIVKALEKDSPLSLVPDGTGSPQP